MKQQIVDTILGAKKSIKSNRKDKGMAFAPANVALCKYWGKRDKTLNLPFTNSLSISLGSYGAHTTLSFIEAEKDSIFLNGQIMQAKPFADRLTAFLNYFRLNSKTSFQVDIRSNLPIAAGLASSAAGFASIVLALNDLYHWALNLKECSILARLGSGSACRSVQHGFMEWEKGLAQNGMDSYAKSIDNPFVDLQIGLLILNAQEKPLSSREAMEKTVGTSHFYAGWQNQVSEDLPLLKKAIASKNFTLLGEISEANALCLHALLLSSRPAILYSEKSTVAAWQKIWALRKEGLELYFTQDAGPNLKLLFQKKDKDKVQMAFQTEKLWVVDPMETKFHEYN